ncbi:MAG: phosphonate metabolism protein/1,5-bisphosphokinase (PRPP-forming) PhnN [Gammaproteobacteria bacterium]|nr:phosphonate metabolism protein/1,5-bisphosphokinase (PRPP-forming) PhnN [Gammaproteobacteria bacterium]MCW8986499.1 phosphonate metabolism protein/1,5-bisphosphokinase (PRPP-forming) PhnN [Gammaproteobacteria bacterium]MCW9031255.1 phosphonate metabolism protein/1,5-bisphosphokinase (PRPP-forming) PhnN [Gammaproteobacteria bacterium]
MAELLIMRVMTMANLYYVIGASGSGKDSLMNFARNHMPENTKAVFTHRYITRPANAGGENHVSLSEKEFNLRKAAGCFAMSWYSHDMYYGISIEINQWLRFGLDVVVNGSRAYLDEATKLYPQLQPVLISVNSDILRERLESRGRETPEQIERRLEQAHSLELQVSHPGLIIIKNNSTVENAGEQFIQLICNQKQTQCA